MSLLPPLPDFANASLDMLGDWLDGDTPPPVEQWHPAREGRIDIRIAADGRWFHEGGEIRRPAMVRLFSRVLRREADGSFVLVTPAEKLTITVEDTPFIAVEMKSEGEGVARRLAFRLNTGEVVVAGADHPLDFDGAAAEPHPTLHVRGTIGNGLTARLERSVYYEAVELALTEGAEPPALWSLGARFPLVAA